jgi:hypothetical protein
MCWARRELIVVDPGTPWPDAQTELVDTLRSLLLAGHPCGRLC